MSINSLFGPDRIHGVTQLEVLPQLVQLLALHLLGQEAHLIWVAVVLWKGGVALVVMALWAALTSESEQVCLAPLLT